MTIDSEFEIVMEIIRYQKISPDEVKGAYLIA